MAAADAREPPSRPFDRILEDGRKRLEALYGEAPATVPPRRAQTRSRLASAAAATGFETAGRPTEGWSHTVIGRLREGDEAVVRCRLVVEGSDIEITRHGRARIARADGAAELAGSSAGIPFALRAEAGPSPEADEAALAEAFERAEAAALQSCIAAL